MDQKPEKDKPDFWDRILLKDGKPYWLTWVLLIVVVIYFLWLIHHIWPTELFAPYNGFDRGAPGGN